MNDRADWQEQQEQERERWELSMDALARAQELGLEERYLKHLAFECGVKFVPNAKPRTAVVG